MGSRTSQTPSISKKIEQFEFRNSFETIIQLKFDIDTIVKYKEYF